MDAAADNGGGGGGAHAVNTPRKTRHTVMLHCSYFTFQEQRFNSETIICKSWCNVLRSLISCVAEGRRWAQFVCL